MKAYPETHQQGLITIEQNINSGGLIGDFGIQVAKDGRIWICINGIATIRFKPLDKEMIELIKKKEPIETWGDFNRKTINNHHQLKKGD